MVAFQPVFLAAPVSHAWGYPLSRKEKQMNKQDYALGAVVLFMFFYGWRFLVYPIAWLMGLL